MQFTRAELEEKLLTAYSANYDVTRLDAAQCGGRQFAYAEFHSTLSRYVLSKEIRLWEAENNEFVYLFSLAELGLQDLEEIREYVLAQGLPRVRPHEEHMYTYITALILADRVPTEVQKAIKRMEFLKNYRFSLHGFSALRAAAWEGESQRCFTNAHGREVGDFVKKLGAERKAKPGIFSR